MEPVFELTREQIVAIFQKWKDADVAGEWAKVADEDVDPQISADTFIEFAKEL